MHKVMLIEDDDTMRALLQTLLEFEGYKVIQQKGDTSLDDYMEWIRSEKPSLILLDVHLRNLTGFDLVRQIRLEDDLHSTRVLMSSGMDLGIECREAGADDFILKPFMPEELVAKIQRALKN